MIKQKRLLLGCEVIDAGIADFKPIEQWDERSFDRSVAINLE